MFFSVENESSREDIFTLQKTLENHWSSDKLRVNWFTSQKVWSCLHPLTQISFSLEPLGSHSKWPMWAARNSQASQTWLPLWQFVWFGLDKCQVPTRTALSLPFLKWTGGRKNDERLVVWDKDRQRSLTSYWHGQNRLNLGRKWSLIYHQSNQSRIVRNKTRSLNTFPPPLLSSQAQLQSLADARAVPSCWAISVSIWKKLGQSLSKDWLSQALFTSAAPAHPVVARWDCQDGACSAAWPRLCRMWPGTLVAFGGRGLSQLFKQFLRSFPSQVKSK